MAEEGRVVSVYGLPKDVDHERLRDKLLIHFLRQSNGGGEVTSVSLIGRTPLHALVTFEESRVVQSVLRYHPHILHLDGIKYELSLSLPNQEPLSLNKAILNMTVTIDCSHLPQGPEALNALQSEFPALIMEQSFLHQTCIMQGSYSDFQSAFPYMQTLFAHHYTRAEIQRRPQARSEKEGRGKKKEDPAGVKKRNRIESQSPGTFGSTVFLGQENYRIQDNNEALTGRSTRDRKSKIEEGAECRTDEGVLEDLSIIMEADVFAYLQSIKEYKRILQHYGVQVVYVTSEGVTTVYLESEVPTGSEVKQNFRQAHKELTQLYQQQEACLRKDQVKISALFKPDGLNGTLKKVQLLLPNVLLSSDQDNIYIVGEKSEVSQAKQILLIGVEEDLMSLPETPPSPYSFHSASPELSEREQQAPLTSVPPKLIGSNFERKGEIGISKEYKLAARFKSPGLLTREEMGGDMRSLTAKIDFFKLAQSSQSTPLTRSLLSTTGELTREGTEAFRMTEPICTGQDILFKNQDPLSQYTFDRTTFNTSKAKPSTSAGLTSTLATGFKSSVNTSVNSLQASNAKVKTAAASSTSVPTSKSPLRRSNSFSGQLREQVKNYAPEPIINTHAYQRVRSNSISGGRPIKDCPVPTVEAELTVSGLIWTYMKEVYHSQLDSMKSKLQMFENQAGKNEISVTLKSTDSSKVEESHRELQNLVATVTSDFSFQELLLNELGVDEKDDLFRACCSSVRTQICKISLYTRKTHLVLIGPKFLCSQVSDIFKNVFSGQKSHSSFLKKLKTLQESLDPGASTAFLSVQSTKANPSNTDHHSKEFSYQDTSLAVQSNSSYSTKQKSTTLEKLENTKSTEDEFSKANSLSQLAKAKEDTTGPKPDSLPLEANKKQDTSKTLKQTNLLSHIASEQCVCGKTGTNVKRTTCGVILCSQCKLLHSHCRVCGIEEVYSEKKMQGDPLANTDPKDSQEQDSGQEDNNEHKGIQGTMRCVEMPFSLQGYQKYTTAKITYVIPDGIQGDTDPYPGSPFEGGQFVAYLPLDPKGKSLLPSLKKAFNQGLTFVIKSKKANGGDAKVSWGKIPHKTSVEGAKSRNGYPDSTYLTLLSDVLLAHGIEGAPAISQDQGKS